MTKVQNLILFQTAPPPPTPHRQTFENLPYKDNRLLTRKYKYHLFATFIFKKTFIACVACQFQVLCRRLGYRIFLLRDVLRNVLFLTSGFLQAEKRHKQKVLGNWPMIGIHDECEVEEELDFA